MQAEPSPHPDMLPGFSFRHIRTWMESELSSVHNSAERDALVKIFLSQASEKSWPLLISEGYEFSTGQFNWLKESIRRLKHNEPWQYILGEVEFAGLRLKVDPGVLIPRPETEELVAMAVNAVRGSYAGIPQLRLLDLATGSGCIALSLKQSFPSAEVDAVDLSGMALDIAKRNARLNDLNVRLMQADLLQFPSREFNAGYHLIISNPPYVKDDEKLKIQPNVIDWEPHMALFVPDNDPLVFYRALARWGSTLLAPSGMMLMELNEALGQETAEVFRTAGFSQTLLLKDFRGKYRFLQVTREPMHTLDND